MANQISDVKKGIAIGLRIKGAMRSEIEEITGMNRFA